MFPVTKIAKSLIALLLAGVISQGQAGIISIEPVSQTVNLNDPVALAVRMNFNGDPTIGGGIDIWYDSTVLGFTGFAVNPAFTASLSFLGSVFAGQPDDCLLSPSELGCGTAAAPITGYAEINGLAWTDLAGWSNNLVMGTLNFTAIGGGTTSVIPLEEFDVASSKGFQAPGSVDQIPVTNPASVTVNVVPLPPAAWLMLSAVGFLGVIGRRRTRYIKS